MNRAIGAAIVFAAVVTVGLFAVDRSEADNTPDIESQVTAPEEAPEEASIFCSDAIELAKKCSTSSDCPNSKCLKGKCGGCSTSSDCKYGKCKSSTCGGCSTSSDCGDWGKCLKGRCGGCTTSSDCGSWGSCCSGKCEKTPY